MDTDNSDPSHFSRPLFRYLAEKVKANAINTLVVDMDVSILSSTSELVIFAENGAYYGPFYSEEDVDTFIALLLLGLVNQGPVLQASFHDTLKVKELKRKSLRQVKENGYKNIFGDKPFYP